MKIYHFVTVAVAASLFLIACNQVDPKTPPIPKVQETEVISQSKLIVIISARGA